MGILVHGVFGEHDVVNRTYSVNLFVSKSSLYCVSFNFSDPDKNTMEKEVKRTTLCELVDFISSYEFSRLAELAILAVG